MCSEDAPSVTGHAPLHRVYRMCVRTAWIESTACPSTLTLELGCYGAMRRLVLVLCPMAYVLVPLVA